MESTEKIIEILKSSDKPLKGGEIAELSGLDKKTVEKAIKQLRADALIDSPKRCYYTAK